MLQECLQEAKQAAALQHKFPQRACIPLLPWAVSAINFTRASGSRHSTHFPTCCTVDFAAHAAASELAGAHGLHDKVLLFQLRLVQHLLGSCLPCAARTSMGLLSLTLNLLLASCTSCSAVTPCRA